MGRKLALRPFEGASSARKHQTLPALQRRAMQAKASGNLAPRNRLPEYLEASEIDALIRCAAHGAKDVQDEGPVYTDAILFSPTRVGRATGRTARSGGLKTIFATKPGLISRSI